MGVIKKIIQKIYNGKDWDTLHPETETSQVLLTDGRKLSTVADNQGRSVVSGNDKAYNINGNLWVGFANIATGPANQYKGVTWEYIIPAAFKCKEIVGKINAIASTDGNSSSSLTTGYVTDSTIWGDNTKISGACYDMTVNMPTRVKVTFFFLSDL